MEGISIQDLLLKEKSPGGFYYVKDEDGGLYEIEAFLGDIPPVSKVFRAKYTMRNADGQLHQEIVALKFARDDGSDEFLNMRQEAESASRIGQINRLRRNIVSDENMVVGISKSFDYAGFFFVSMPYMKGGSLRYIINSRMLSRKLPNEQCIAVVLRETLKAISVLHTNSKVHRKLHAGNIYVSDLRGRVAIKLAYEGSTYFHYPDFDNNPKIWDEIFHTEQRKLCFYASSSQENEFWTIDRPYEPSMQLHYNLYAADLWNFGVTALELALGPLRAYSNGRIRNQDELCTFLTNLQQNQENRLPTLYQLFIVDQQENTSTATDESNKTAGKMMMEGMRNAAKEVKGLGKKMKGKIIAGKSKPNPPGNQLSDSFIAMVKRCLVLDPNKRPTALQLLLDPFFVEHQNVNLQYFADVILANNPIPIPECSNFYGPSIYASIMQPAPTSKFQERKKERKQEPVINFDSRNF